MKAGRSPHDAIVVPTRGPLYAGRAGQTRTERLHLVEPDGSVRSVELHRVVNVMTDPALKPRVLAGQLHRLDDGRELALPFVYHDPLAHKFALVIPPVLAHLEMKEWARLMTEVAEDTGSPVPEYVRDGTTVLGLPALELFLESGIEPDDTELSDVAQRAAPAADREKALHARDQALAERERVMVKREREIAEQEQSLLRLAGDLSARDDSLTRREQQVATAHADLEAREAEVAEQRARARGDAGKGKTGARGAAAGQWQEVRVASAGFESDSAATVVSEVPQPIDPAYEVQDSELRDVAQAEVARPAPAGAAARGSHTPPPLKRNNAPRTPPPLRPSQPTMAAVAAVNAPASAGAAVTPVAPAPRGRSSAPPPMPSAAEAQRASRAPEATAEPLRASVPSPPHVPDPPVGFTASAPLSMATRFADNELWLFVQLDAKRAAVYDEEAELLVQLIEVDGRPVVMFALLGAANAVARAALDALAADTRAILERIERVFRAQVAVYVAGELRSTRMILAPREQNARAVLERIARPRPTPSAQASDAIERALKRPPPVRDEQLPFGPPRPQAASTASVLSALERLEQWAQPEKLEQALLVYSIPKHVIDASVRRALRAAIGFGIALPPRLSELAIEHKLADGKPQLVREQLAAFKQRIERGQNDLDAADSLRNWEKLFAQAEELDLVLDSSLRAWVERTAKESGAPPPDLPMSAAELRRDLGDPGRRIEAVRELCRRGHSSALASIFEVLEELSPEEVATAVANLLVFGEQAADGLVTALGSPSQYVRHACALGLGQLRSRRSLAPLIRQIETESTASWTEMARALGDFGPAALRNVSRAIQGSDRRERLMVGLAHLANHGAAEEVKTLESDPEPAIAHAARQALARCSRMEWDDQAVRNQQQLRDNSPETRFSQVFYAELARATG
jgi:hypothetical protein